MTYQEVIYIERTLNVIIQNFILTLNNVTEDASLGELPFLVPACQKKLN
jgi:hypothetical protein